MRICAFIVVLLPLLGMNLIVARSEIIAYAGTEVQINIVLSDRVVSTRNKRATGSNDRRPQILVEVNENIKAKKNGSVVDIELPTLVVTKKDIMIKRNGSLVNISDSTSVARKNAMGEKRKRIKLDVRVATQIEARKEILDKLNQTIGNLVIATPTRGSTNGNDNNGRVVDITVAGILKLKLNIKEKSDGEIVVSVVGASIDRKKDFSGKKETVVDIASVDATDTTGKVTDIGKGREDVKEKNRTVIEKAKQSKEAIKDGSVDVDTKNTTDLKDGIIKATVMTSTVNNVDEKSDSRENKPNIIIRKRKKGENIATTEGKIAFARNTGKITEGRNEDRKTKADDTTSVLSTKQTPISKKVTPKKNIPKNKGEKIATTQKGGKINIDENADKTVNKTIIKELKKVIDNAKELERKLKDDFKRLDKKVKNELNTFAKDIGTTKKPTKKKTIKPEAMRGSNRASVNTSSARWTVVMLSVMSLLHSLC